MSDALMVSLIFCTWSARYRRHRTLFQMNESQAAEGPGRSGMAGPVQEPSQHLSGRKGCFCISWECFLLTEGKPAWCATCLEEVYVL